MAGPQPDIEARAFYRRAMLVLRAARIPFLVGGGWALRHYTGISRRPKDLDLFVLPSDLKRVLHALAEADYETELTAAHWIGKVRSGNAYIDVIIRGGNGYGDVDAAWFAHAEEGRALGLRTLICPAEETIWSKAFVMERERYDGADVAHLLHAVGTRLDWARLLIRFGDHWRVLFAYVVLFGFIYPGVRGAIPEWVTNHLTARLRRDQRRRHRRNRLCRGPLLSSKQYRIDVGEWGYDDGSLRPHGRLTQRQSAER